MKHINYLTKSLGNLIVKRIASPFWHRRWQISRSQYMSQDELLCLQTKLLLRMVEYSYQYVPFYRKKMDDLGIQPVDIKGLEDIVKLPILSKKQVREAGDDIISSKYSKWQLRAARTGGSTGAPMIIWRNWDSIGNEHAFVRRQWEWAGLKLSDRCAFLMSKVVVTPGTQNPRLYFYDPIMRELLLSTYHLSHKNAMHYVEICKKYNIRALVGYPSALSFVAKVCLEENIEFPLQAALTTSEIVSPEMREVIAKAFKCRVYDYYGSAERVCYIYTCEKGSYHVIPEYGYTEMIPISESEPQRCRIISTGFWNYGMPLIRYETGDVVVKSEEKCPCGRNFQVIKSIDGRDGDVIKTLSGRQLGVTLIIQLLYVICGSRCISESQMIQDSIDHVTIEYVPTVSFTSQDLDEFKKKISEYIPEELSFDFKKVEKCRRTESGKLRPLVSLI